jgi:predicted exporter
MRVRPPIGVWLWLLVLAAAALIAARARYIADLSAFLPSNPSPTQQLLVQQLQDGLASRLILIGIQGGDAAMRARASQALAAALRERLEFASVSNGGSIGQEKDREFLFHYRYALSDAITPQRFSASGLQAAIADEIDLMASPAGLLAKSLFQSDPTGETLQVIDQLDAGRQPTSAQGVWSSQDGRRALLLVQTRASGSDTDAQEQALRVVRAAWTAASAGMPLQLLMSSPGKFAVDARATIKQQALRLSLLSGALIVLLLLVLYRSLSTLAFGLLPVVSGALLGVAAVALGFGVVHGITLGFGVTLIGESVDYSIYLFVQSRGGIDAPLRTLWRTIVLGVLTSVCGFASLLPSSFPGLAQLGLFSISGLIAAAAVTRFTLPALLPRKLAIADLTPLGLGAARVLSRLQLPRVIYLGIALLCALILNAHRDRLWNRDIAALSPVSVPAQRLDSQLRTDLGAPDIGSLIVLTGHDAQSVLKLSESVGSRLDALISQGVIAGYDTPARYLPSEATQLSRRTSVPSEGQLRERLVSVSAALSLQSDVLEPFVQQVTLARLSQPITRATLDGTSFALALDALLWQRDKRWHAMLPLRAASTGPAAGQVDLAQVRQTLSGLAPGQILVLNIKQETDALYGSYMSEAIHLSLAGFGAIVLLLALTLRNVRRVARVFAPLMLAVLVVAASFALAGTRMTILHLIGMLLIVAVGSNYALFFDSRAQEADRNALPLTLASLLIANTCTVVGFGVLAFSSVPVLSALGSTVAPGTLLALWFAALIAPAQMWKACARQP